MLPLFRDNVFTENTWMKWEYTLHLFTFCVNLRVITN